MKYLILVIVMMSCGRNDSGNKTSEVCNTFKQRQFQCFQDMSYHYGIDYATHDCNHTNPVPTECR